MGDYNKKILTVTDLKKSYITKGNTYPVLQGIHMEVNQGEFIAVMDRQAAVAAKAVYESR